MARSIGLIGRLRFLLAAGALLVLLPVPVWSQSAIPNPLRAAPADEKPADRPRVAQRAKPDEKAETSAKPKRERSAKQKENDEMMRACGSSWRAEKAALQAKGETWRSFLKECRAKKKSEQKA
jgi:hypothetical protein